MNRTTLIALFMLTTALIGCDSAPGRGRIEAQNIAPDTILDFSVLYSTNCSACHGPDGRGGPAIALSDPIYLAVADDAVLRAATSDGVPATAMPAFARKAGGLLADEQIDAIVNGMRTRWANPHAVTGLDLPPYAGDSPGDARRGGEVFTTYCASCHGDRGQGARASSIVDRSYLALVSDQGLRTTVIAGRPELGAPDWRGNVRGRPMTPQDISDVVAWLSAKRPPGPAQP